jgi:hypothetical protein
MPDHARKLANKYEGPYQIVGHLENKVSLIIPWSRFEGKAVQSVGTPGSHSLEFRLDPAAGMQNQDIQTVPNVDPDGERLQTFSAIVVGCARLKDDRSDLPVQA